MITKRRNTSADAIQQRKERNARYYAAHKQQISQYAKEYSKKYRETHKEQIRQNAKLYCVAHKTQLVDNHKKWRQQHKQAIMEMSDEEFLIAAGLKQP